VATRPHSGHPGNPHHASVPCPRRPGLRCRCRPHQVSPPSHRGALGPRVQTGL